MQTANISAVDFANGTFNGFSNASVTSLQAGASYFGGKSLQSMPSNAAQSTCSQMHS